MRRIMFLLFGPVVSERCYLASIEHDVDNRAKCEVVNIRSGTAEDVGPRGDLRDRLSQISLG